MREHSKKRWNKKRKEKVKPEQVTTVPDTFGMYNKRYRQHHPRQQIGKLHKDSRKANDGKTE
jgi:hypothetical protein